MTGFFGGWDDFDATVDCDGVVCGIGGFARGATLPAACFFGVGPFAAPRCGMFADPGFAGLDAAGDFAPGDCSFGAEAPAGTTKNLPHLHFTFLPANLASIV